MKNTTKARRHEGRATKKSGTYLECKIKKTTTKTPIKKEEHEGERVWKHPKRSEERVFVQFEAS